MASDSYMHRDIWRRWVQSHRDEPFDFSDVDITTTLNVLLCPRGICERRMVVDSISDEGYHALLIATYRDGELFSLVLDDDEGRVTVLVQEG